MRVIVTGASSFLGQALLRELEKENEQSGGLQNGADRAGLQPMTGAAGQEKSSRADMLCSAAVKSAGTGFEIIAFRHSFEEAPERLPERADAWVHFAWAGVGSAGRSDRKIQDYNVEMSMAALQKAAALGCTRFLFAGSQAEYGKAKLAAEPDDVIAKEAAYVRKIDVTGKTVESGGGMSAENALRLRKTDIAGDISAAGSFSAERESFNSKIFEVRTVLRQCENAVCQPQSEYGKAKLAFGQRAARWTADWNEDDVPQRLRFVHMRIFSVYGPGDHAGSLIQSCMEHFEKQEAMQLGPCTQDWDYLYIDDAARAVAGLLRSETAEGIYNVASGHIRPLREFVLELREFLQSGSELQFGVRGNNAEGAVPLCPSVRRLREETGFQPQIGFLEGVRRLREAMRAVPGTGSDIGAEKK